MTNNKVCSYCGETTNFDELLTFDTLCKECYLDHHELPEGDEPNE